MAYFTSVMGRGVGLVEIFRNPHGREWQTLLRYADPVDGLRGYLIGGDVYLWGSVPLHRDLQPLMQEEVAQDAGAWLAIQINPRIRICLLSDCVTRDGTPIAVARAEEILRRSMPLQRLLGPDFLIRRTARAEEEQAAAREASHTH